MAIADTITTLGNNIVSLINTRANKDLSNLSTTGEAKITASSASVPVGTVIAYMGTTVPDGYLLMDGREVSKTTYADLYAVIGDTQGTATQDGYFVIADMTDGRYLMGSTVAGGSVGTSIDEALPNINGTIQPIPSGAQDGNSGASGAFTNGTIQTDLSKYNGIYGNAKAQYRIATFNASLSSSIYQDDAHVTPMSCVTCFYIKFSK